MTAESNITKDMSISLLSFFVKLNIINLMQRGHNLKIDPKNKIINN